MTRCISIDEHNYVTGVFNFNPVPEGYIEIADEEYIPNLTHFIKYQDGVFIDTLQPRMPPNPYMVWNPIEAVWVDARSIEELREDKWASIKLQREDAEYSGFEFSGNIYDSDSISQAKIQGAVQLALISLQAGTDFSIEWTLKNNSTVLLTSNEMVALGQCMATHINDCHVKGRVLRDQIALAVTKEELDTIVW